ncbi:MAG TPA: hypothetical protein PKO15_04130 [Fibrobacteria bacterium]|nr:hypothetical protein [Fibrobacteria bacterium]HOX52425.1 hypothetical protein [Fibrobacteria bacterium]
MRNSTTPSTIAAGLTGGDPIPGVLGYSGCADNTLAPQNRRGSAPELFGFNPEIVWIGGYMYPKAGAPKFDAGTTVPVYFYKDATTSRFRASTTWPNTNANCARLGGYGFAVN